MTAIGLTFLPMMTFGGATIFPRLERTTLRLVAGTLLAVSGAIAVILSGHIRRCKAPDLSDMSIEPAHSVPEGPP